MKLSTLLSAITLSSTAILSSLATAGTINTYQFVDSGNSWTTYGTENPATIGTGPNSNLGSSKIFTGSNGLNTTVTFFENVSDTGTGGTGVDGYWGHGLTVAGDSHSDSRVDNNGEAILFNFGTDVTALSSFFYGWVDCCNTDVGVFYNNNGSWSSITTSAFSGYLTLGLNNIVSDQFLFVNVDTYSGNDTWALKGFAVETISVPEPGTAALLALGLAGLVFSRRTQKNT